MKEMTLLQEVIFDNGEQKYKLMHQRGEYEWNGSELVINSKKRVSFDTYFNMFDIDKWKKYTVIDSIRICLSVRGKGRVNVYQINSKLVKSEVVSKDFDFEENNLLEIDIYIASQLQDNLYFDIEAYDNVYLQSGGYYTYKKPINNVSIACCFCTYRREADIVRNVNNIIKDIVNNNKSNAFGITDIYVADNGQTLSLDSFMKSDRIHLFPNKNYGGSSGFARCLMEAQCGKNKGRYTHLILMDDDALIKAFVVERTVSILQFVKENYKSSMIGGALLSIEQQYLQMENGSLWSVDRNRLRGRNVDLSILKNVVNNQKDSVNYNGWFFTCIPVELVDENSLPIPFFLHGDDIEFGLRSKNEFIRMNGICIWHPNPLTSRRPYIAYYDARNFTIMNNVHYPDLSAFSICKRELRYLFDLALCYRYEESLYRIKGMKDYLRGIDWFKNVDATNLNKYIMGWIKYEEISLESDVKYDKMISKELHDNRCRQLFNWFLPAKKVRYYENTVGWYYMDSYRSKKYYIIDSKTRKGIVVKKDYLKLIKVILEFVSLSFLLLTKYNKVASEYKRRLGELKNYSFWKQYLDL